MEPGDTFREGGRKFTVGGDVSEGGGGVFDVKQGQKKEHFCPEHWVLDGDRGVICGICGRHSPDETKKARAEQARKEAEDAVRSVLEEAYEIEMHSPRVEGKDWDGQWVKWKPKTGTGQWDTPKRAKAAVRQAPNGPTTFRLVKVKIKPAVVVSREVEEVVGNGGHDVDFNFQNVSKSTDEPENPTMSDYKKEQGEE